MKTTIFLILITTTLSLSQILPTEPGMIKQLPIPMDKQINHIRKLATFYFKQAQWKLKFSENMCPEYTELVVIDYTRYCTKTNPMPVPPLPPITVCEIDKNRIGCNFTPRGEEPVEIPEDLNQEIIGDGDVTPNCLVNPKLCLPPTYCDIPANRFGKVCEDVNMNIDCDDPANYEDKACVFVSRCEMDGFRDLPGCEEANPCRSHPELCLTICDREEFKDSKRCLFQKCNLFPDLPECDEVKSCLVNNDCLTDTDILVNNECCPNAICNYECKEGDDHPSCPVVPPEEACKWGYHLGEAVTDIFIEPVQKQDLDQDGVSAVLSCYNEIMKSENSVELKCFEGAIETGYTAITESLKQTIENLTGEYDNFEYTTDEENLKKITMKSDRKNGEAQ